jgi:hypothetical protein
MSALNQKDMAPASGNTAGTSAVLDLINEYRVHSELGLTLKLIAEQLSDTDRNATFPAPALTGPVLARAITYATEKTFALFSEAVATDDAMREKRAAAMVARLQGEQERGAH